MYAGKSNFFAIFPQAVTQFTIDYRFDVLVIVNLIVLYEVFNPLPPPPEKKLVVST